MTEALFILTLVFVAYVVYIMVTDTSSGSQVGTSAVDVGQEPAAKAAKETAAAETPAAEKAVAPESRAAEKAAALEEKADIETSAATAEAMPKGLRNPKTGDVAAIPSNYRFAKRWIKEAMVAEGLLDRIYKNNELDEANSEKVKEALESFKALEKYHA